MIRILLDQGIPRSSVVILRANGFDVEHVADIDMSTADDAAIIDHARREHRGIVTLDADFHALLAIRGASSPSVLRIRKEGLRGPELAQFVQEIFKRIGAEWVRGALVTATDTAIRLRRLPVVRS